MLAGGSRRSRGRSDGLPKFSESKMPVETPPRRVENACATPIARSDWPESLQRSADDEDCAEVDFTKRLSGGSGYPARYNRRNVARRASNCSA